jgi:outer membrane receptor protein involved in Fe transport
MKQLLCLLSVLALAIAHAAPDPENDLKGSITGIVYDDQLDVPLPYVTVAIETIDGEIITGGVTDESGRFLIEGIPAGKKSVSIQFVGYTTYTTTIDITRENREIDMGTIKLAEEAAALDEVHVVAERSTIQQKIDRKVITIGKDLQTAGPTASDIMNNLPSVNLDQQTGEISLRGNQNVQVMVDGKLTNVPIAQLLRQIPSTSIKQIELITSPSAKYNPEGMSGIINIVLHKNVNVGFNGNANVGLTYQKQPKFTSNIDMNYRNGKLNFYGNWGHNTSKNENFGHIVRPDENSEQFFDILDDSQSNLIKAGVDFYLDDRNTFSFFTNQNFFTGGTEGMVDIRYYEDMLLDQQQDFLSVRENLSSQYNFDYKHDFEKEGHNIELETDYNRFESEEDATFLFQGASPIDDYMDFVDTDRSRLTVNLDYVNPLNETTKLEAGAQARLFETEILYNSTGETFNSSGVLVPTPSTDFNYKRDIYSAYLSLNKQLGKFSVQLGARFETVEVRADTNTTRAFTNDYTQLYPSAFVTYKPTEKNQFQLSYSRRVDRPGLSQVNPIREWATPLISSFGNTQLQPQFTNSMEANYTRNLNKGSITGGVFYRLIEDEINRAVFVDPTDVNKAILTFDNFDDTFAYGVELSSNYKPARWWNFNFSFDLFYQVQKGITERLADGGTGSNAIIRESIEVDNTAWNLRWFNNFKATDDLTFSLFGFYRGQARGLQFEAKPMYFVNIGARYNLWEGRGTFSINYNDIFNTMRFAFDGDRPFPQEGAFNWESNTVFVGLSYRFGGGKYRAKSRKRRDDNVKSDGGGIF